MQLSQKELEEAKRLREGGMGFADIYKIAAALGTPAPCKIIAVEPKQLNFNAHLSGEVEKSIPEIIKLVMMETKRYA